MTSARDIGGDHQQITSLDTKYADITFKLLLLPVWVASFRFRRKTFRFIINGVTGEVQGQRPYSVWKVTLAAIAALLAILVFVFVMEAQ